MRTGPNAQRRPGAGEGGAVPLLLLPLVLTLPLLAAAAPLGDLYGGAVTRFDHPRGWFGFEMPAGWQVVEEREDTLVVNPGFSAGDTLDAIVLVTYGELDESERGVGAAALMRRHGDDFRLALLADGIALDTEVPEPEALSLDGRDGAALSWRGTAGGQPVSAWIGGVTEGSHYLIVIGVALDAAAGAYLPGVRRIYASLVTAPPERNHALENALVGLRFFSSSHVSDSSFHSTYEFPAPGRVKSASYFTGSIGLDQASTGTEEWGSFEVIGDELHLSLESGDRVFRVYASGGEITGLGNDEGITLSRR